MNKWLRATAVMLACATVCSIAYISLTNSWHHTEKPTQELSAVSGIHRAVPQKVLEGTPVIDDSLIILAGDSLAAGEGAGNYALETREPEQACHRSAAGIMSHLVSAERRKIVGCSRATINDFAGTSNYVVAGSDEAPNQLAAIAREQPDAVVLLVGANDIGFPQLLDDCLVTANTDCSGDTAVRQRTAELLDGLGPKLEKLYVGLLDATDAQILVPAYPDLLNGQGTCGRINGAERAYGQAVIAELNEHIHAAVQDVGREHRQGSRLVFAADTAQALDGHGPCSEDSWINPYGTVSLAKAATSGTRAQEILHPTATGYAALTKSLAPYFRL